MALLARYLLRNFASPDYKVFLEPWYQYISTHDFAHVRDTPADYPTPYLYLLWLVARFPIPPILAIKSIGFIFDFVLAFAVYKMVKLIRPDDSSALYAAFATLLLPTVVLNSAAWAQSDSLYTSLGLLALYLSLRERQLASWLLWGFAIAFKLQAVFFLPVLIYLWFLQTRNGVKSVLAPLAALASFALTALPALLTGGTVQGILGKYVDLTNEYPALSKNAPSIWAWFPNDYAALHLPAILLAAAATAGVLWATYFYVHVPAGLSVREAIILPTAIAALLPFLLPAMHDRYSFSAEILGLIIAFCLGGRWFLLALGFQLTALSVYLMSLFVVRPFSIQVTALAQLCIVTVLVVVLFAEALARHRRSSPDVTSIL